MQWLLAHWPMLLAMLIALMSEVLPFLPTKANGIVQAILNVLKALPAPKPPTNGVQ